MRILFLASYFPRPEKPVIGTWALAQAAALAGYCDIRVACCTSYVPSIFAMVPKARPWIRVPQEYVWRQSTALTDGCASDQDVHTTYLKCLLYQTRPFKSLAYANPEPQMAIAWRSVRKRLLEMVDEFKPDLIYCHHTAVNGFFAEKLRHLRGLPFVATDLDFLEVSDCEHLPKRRRMFERITSAAANNFCVANRMERDMQRLFPAARSTTVHFGIHPMSPEIFSTPRPTELRGKQIVLSVGIFAARKGIPLLVEAFAGVARRFPNAVLRIVGDGQERGVIESTINRLSLQDRVQLLGIQPSATVFQEMAWADVFALVGWNEPFATVFIEAMGAGTPIVTASDGGINDVVRDGVHGRVVPPRDVQAASEALIDLLSDDRRRKEMGVRAKLLVDEQLTWRANARTMIKLFEEIIQTNKANRKEEAHRLTAAGR